MAEEPFTKFLENWVDSGDLTKEVITKVKALLHGVKTADGQFYHYSCPFPFLYDPKNPGSKYGMATMFANNLLRQAAKLKLLDGNGAPLPDMVLFEQLFLLNDLLPRVAIYPGYASGDMYGFGASMAIDPQMRMLIVKDANPPGGRIDRSAATKGFIDEVLGSGRVEVVTAPRVFAKNPNPSKKPKGAEKQYLDALHTHLWQLFAKTGKVHVAVDLFFGTRYVALNFQALKSSKGDPRRTSRARVRKAWLKLDGQGEFADSSRQGKLETFIKSRTGGSMPQGANIAVLWSRFTGKTGGAHVEYDTSRAGLRQLVECAFAGGAEYVFIAGDAPKTAQNAPELKKTKAKQFMGELQKAIHESQTGSSIKVRRKGGVVVVEKKLVDLLEFWNLDEWYTANGATKGVSKPQRIDQFKLFEVLARGNKVKHIGARSGNLESLALLGYDVRYFEDGVVDKSWEDRWTLSDDFWSGELGKKVSNSEQPLIPPEKKQQAEEAMDKQRMVPWHDTVGYKRIKIASVPTRSGKYLLSQQALESQPKWSYPTRLGADINDEAQVSEAYASLESQSNELPPLQFASWEERQKAVAPWFKPKVDKFGKGFTMSDLIEIANYLSF